MLAGVGWAVACGLGQDHAILSTVQATFDGTMRTLYWTAGKTPQECAEEYCQRYIIAPHADQVRSLQCV